MITVRTIEQHRRWNRYRRVVTNYLAEHGSPCINDTACSSCSAPVGQRCTGSTTCASRVAAHYEALTAHRAAARAFAEEMVGALDVVAAPATRVIE